MTTLDPKIARLLQPAPWVKHAACRGHTTIFFPEPGQTAQRAQAICATCPVQHPCREAGMSEQFGIWGGTTPRARNKRGAAA